MRYQILNLRTSSYLNKEDVSLRGASWILDDGTIAFKTYNEAFVYLVAYLNYSSLIEYLYDFEIEERL